MTKWIVLSWQTYFLRTFWIIPKSQVPVLRQSIDDDWIDSLAESHFVDGTRAFFIRFFVSFTYSRCVRYASTEHA